MTQETEEIVAPAGTEEISESPKPAAVPEAAPTEGIEEQQKESEQQKQEQEQEQKHKGGFQRKIDKLTAERYRLREEMAEMRGRLAAQPAAASTPKPATEDDPMPDSKTWTGTWEDLQVALSRWAARQEHKELSAKEREAAAKAEREERDQEVVTSYRERMQEFVADHDDFVEVVGRAKLAQEISGPVQVAIMEDEHGPELAYYLGENPEVCQHLSAMTAVGAVTYLGRISERLFPEVSDEEEEPEEDNPEKEESDSEAEPPPPTPKLERPKLPAPITPTRKSAPTDSGLSDSLSTEEWARRFSKKMKYGG